jgi:beta-glucosidase
LGGGSATVFPSYTVSPLAGIRAALAGTAKVSHTVGAHAHTRIPIARPQYLWRVDGNGHGVEVTFLGTDGSALATEARKRGSYMWLGSFSHELPTDEVAQVRLRTRIRATASGRYHIGASGIGRFRLRIDTEEIFDVDLQLPAEADVMEAMMVPPQRIHGVNLNAGQELDIALVHDVPPGTMSDGGFTVMQFNLQPPRRSDEDEIKRAVTLARGADAAVVVVGTNDEVESEGFDRTSLTLPGRQDELVTRVAAANPRTVVVVNSGSPVLLPWADQVAAILVTWFPGQEFGNALADVLLGMTDPGGRLPMTWPDTEENLPPTQPDKQGALTYHEGLHIGYRRHQSQRSTARYPFGHGLGYTTWDYLALDAPATATAGHELRVNVHLRNSGPRPGREVVQLYLNRPDSEVERPGRWLAGFATVEAAAGQKVVATVAIHPRAFRHWQIANGSWGVEPGTFHLEAGSSSVLLPLSTAVKFDPPHETIKTVKRSPARRTETPQARRGDQADGTRSAGRRPVII